MAKQTKAERIASGRPINERALLKTGDACDYLSISRSLLDQFRAGGDIKAVPVGNRSLRYRRLDLDDLIEKMANRDTHLDRMTAGAVG